MTLLGALVFAALAVAGSRLPAVMWWAAAGTALACVWPAAAVPAAAAGAGLAVVRARSRTGVPTEADVVLLADLVVLGLRSGLTLEGALWAAVPDLPAGLGDEVLRVLREARRSGMVPALVDAEGKAERLYRLAARAAESGAELAPAVEALAGELRHIEHARDLAAARRLPVRLLLPLALLILPGFVLSVIGPALIGSLARLEIGW